MKRLLVLAAALAALAAFPSLSSAASYSGVVVAKEGRTGYVASARGDVRALATTARVGSRVSVSGSNVRVLGRTNRAVVRGVLIRRAKGHEYVAAARHVLAVGTPAETPTTQPGDIVQTEVTIGAQGALDGQQTVDVGHSSAVQIQAPVTAVGAGTVTVTVNGQPLTVPLPGGLTLPQTLVGSTVTLNVTFGSDSSASGSDDEQGDDDSSDDESDDDSGEHDHQGGDDD